MTVSRIPAEHLRALYDYNKARREAYKEQAYMILGAKCSLCGSTDTLRHRFVDEFDPRANQYRTNPITLFRRICIEPELRNDLYLICRECRIALSAATTRKNCNPTPGYKPLDKPSTKGEFNGCSC
jgi:hypothetical protein